MRFQIGIPHCTFCCISVTAYHMIQEQVCCSRLRVEQSKLWRKLLSSSACKCAECRPHRKVADVCLPGKPSVRAAAASSAPNFEHVTVSVTPSPWSCKFCAQLRHHTLPITTNRLAKRVLNHYKISQCKAVVIFSGSLLSILLPIQCNGQGASNQSHLTPASCHVAGRNAEVCLDSEPARPGAASQPAAGAAAGTPAPLLRADSVRWPVLVWPCL